MPKKLELLMLLAAILLCVAFAPGDIGLNRAWAQTAALPHPQVDYEEWFKQAILDGYFSFNRANIRPDANTALSADAEALSAHPNISFTIEGDCDERGSEAYNLRLGSRRADSARAFFIAHGIAPSRIKTVSFGKDHPVCAQHDAACWQENRRVHLAFLAAGS